MSIFPIVLPQTIFLRSARLEVVDHLVSYIKASSHNILSSTNTLTSGEQGTSFACRAVKRSHKLPVILGLVL